MTTPSTENSQNSLARITHFSSFEAQECLICSDSNYIISNCSICNQSWCYICDSKLGSCPFCRTFISGRHNIEESNRISNEQQYFNSSEDDEQSLPPIVPPRNFARVRRRRIIYRPPYPYRQFDSQFFARPPVAPPIPPRIPSIGSSSILSTRIVIFISMIIIYLVYSIWNVNCAKYCTYMNDQRQYEYNFTAF